MWPVKFRCWSCGTEIPGGWRHIFTCPQCSTVEELKKIREKIESSQFVSISGCGEITGIFEAGFEEISMQLENIASILEWGLEELSWKIDQMTGVLQSIDKTLRTPSQTQSNEWRQIAEELRRRGVLDESEKFFLKSLNTNPLDYRTHIGLGKTELQLGRLNEARTCWEKSLLHAPKGEIDYKSYSHRLIGRTYFCENNPRQAAATLQKSIELSPNYYLGHYDFAQYSALIGNKKNCLSSLRIAVIKGPIPIELVERERSFEPLRKEIEDLLKRIKSNEKLQKERILRRLNLFDKTEKLRKKLSRRAKHYAPRRFYRRAKEKLEWIEKEISVINIDEFKSLSSEKVIKNLVSHIESKIDDAHFDLNCTVPRRHLSNNG